MVRSSHVGLCKKQIAFWKDTLVPFVQVTKFLVDDSEVGEWSCRACPLMSSACRTASW